MRAVALAVLFLPTATLATPQCALAQPEPALAVAAPSAPDLAVTPALQHIQQAGAQLTELGTLHGLRAVFARSGHHFQVFYLTPDGQAVVGGVLWDADGNNLTRKQVEGIEGVIPTVRIGSVPDAAQLQPSGSLLKAAEATSYGTLGNASAPRLWMFVDPQCSFSVRAMQRLQPFVASGRVQLAIVPVSILDHEDGGLSTKTALSLLSLPPDQIAVAWAAGKVTAAIAASPRRPFKSRSVRRDGKVPSATCTGSGPYTLIPAPCPANPPRPRFRESRPAERSRSGLV